MVVVVRLAMPVAVFVTEVTAVAPLGVIEADVARLAAGVALDRELVEFVFAPEDLPELPEFEPPVEPFGDGDGSMLVPPFCR
jgi:hypothetical protein